MGHTRVFSLTFKNRLGALGFTGGECGSAAPLTVGHGHTIMCHSLLSGEQDFDVLRLPLIRNVERGKKWKLEDVFLSIRV